MQPNFFDLTPSEKKEKTPTYQNIGEVAKDLGLPQHVLRFWETKFSEIKPVKRNNGRRYYRQQDVEIIRKIKTLLYDKKYTISGAKAALKNKADVKALPSATPELHELEPELRSILSEINSIRVSLRNH